MNKTESILKLDLESSPSLLSLIESSATEDTLELNDCRNTTMITAGYYSSAQTSINSMEKQIENNVDTLDLLLSISDIDEDIILHNNGYLKINKICDTLQGELLRAIKIDTNSSENVAIKKTDKILFKKKIAMENNFNFCVSENILKESFILKYLTVDNTPIGNYIIKYLDFFESHTHYYLVMEYIESTITLKQFVSISHQYIQNGLLSIKAYNQCIKYLLWQLFTTIQWLHISMHCCHLDVCMENILLINANFIETKNGISIHPKVSIKISDFGVSEIFNSETRKINFFLCEKHGLSIDNELYFAPNIFNGEIYDARCADNWSLGIILFECITGQCLYGAMDINTNSIKSGYWALHNNELKKYLKLNNILKYFNGQSFDLLNGLLNVHQYQRLKGMDILRHKWFKTYFKEYQVQIAKKFKASNKRKSTDYDRFPFYH